MPCLYRRICYNKYYIIQPVLIESQIKLFVDRIFYSAFLTQTYVVDIYLLAAWLQAYRRPQIIQQG